MSDFRDEVRIKLGEVFGDSTEDLIRVLFFLDGQDKYCADQGDAAVSPYWRSLKAFLNNDKSFRAYAMRLSDDTRTAEQDPAFRRIIHDLYENMMRCSETPLPEGEGQGWQLVRAGDPRVLATSSLGGFSYSWANLPPETQGKIMAFIPKIAAYNSTVASYVNQASSLVGKVGGTVATVGLAAVFLCYEAYQSIRRWWKGEISGKRCVKLVIDSTISTAAGVGGGIGGVMVGSFFGPWGSVIGGLVGGVGCSQAASILSDRLTQWIFSLPKDEALENAYNFLGVQCNASNSHVNTAYRRLCLRHHPDKGGNANDFFLLQTHMANIRMARGEM